MKQAVVVLIILLACSTFARQEPARQQPASVIYFDVLDLPARIDEPKLEKTAKDYMLKCALVNRSGEELVGLRLTLMLADSAGKVRTRLSWNQAARVAPYSIKTFDFPVIIKEEINNSNLFLAIDEVVGRETIWRTVDVDRLLRAYARGQHDLIPKVQMLTNKFDPPERAIAIPREEQQ